MTGRLRALVGVMTTLLLAGVGASLLAEGATMWGALACAASAFRAVVLVRALRGAPEAVSVEHPPGPGPR